MVTEFTSSLSPSSLPMIDDAALAPIDFLLAPVATISRVLEPWQCELSKEDIGMWKINDCHCPGQLSSSWI